MEEQKAPQTQSRISRTKSWPRIHTQMLPSGQRSFVIDVQVDGTRIFRRFSTMKDAEEEAGKLRAQREQEGNAGFSLPAAIRVAAARCSEKLTPYNATLDEATDYYINHVLKFRTTPTIAEVINQIVKTKQDNGRRADTVANFQIRANRFAETFGTRRLSEITPDEIRAWLNSTKAHGAVLSPVSKINYLVAIGNIFTHGVRQGYCDRNPVALIDRPSREAADIHFLTVEQVVALMVHAKKYELVPYVALGVFAGLRPDRELRQLDWSKINLTERTIRIDASLAKTRQRRVIEISEALAAYLAPYAKHKGAVVPMEERDFRARWEQCREDAGIKSWPHDAMRHTYATFHLAQHNDIGKLSLQMGNSATVIHSNYKGLISTADAARFWALRPAAGADNIVPMKVANA